MTIAAGFCCFDGVVLSADTLVTASPSKLHETKIKEFSFDGGKVGFTFAGNVAASLDAIDKIEIHLKKQKRKDPLLEIRSVLEKEYRRQVIDHPDHHIDGGLDYEFLFALWLPKERVKLYGTNGVSVYPINTWEAIGIGADLARFIITQGHPPSRILDALKTSSYALSSIKDSVDGCGGMSIHLVFANNGETGIATSMHNGPCKDLQEYAKAYDLTTHELLSQVANEDATDEDCKKYIDTVLTPRLLEKRRQWAAWRSAWEKGFLSRNPALTPDQATQERRRWSTGVLPAPQPSRDSSGGSDEP